MLKYIIIVILIVFGLGYYSNPDLLDDMLNIKDDVVELSEDTYDSAKDTVVDMKEKVGELGN
jgi:hypothetical protein